MKERPILFSREMVRAILAGRKTQTRRIVRPQPKKCHHDDDLWIWGPPNTRLEALLRLVAEKCKYGVPGDRLWVKETHGLNTDEKDASGHPLVAYRAEGDFPPHMVGAKWHPSIFMPRWASRITLEITSVRVERLQDISEADAKAEGGPEILGFKDEDGECGHMTYHDWYSNLWEKINGPGSWALNPWVWVIGFNQIKP